MYSIVIWDNGTSLWAVNRDIITICLESPEGINTWTVSVCHNTSNRLLEWLLFNNLMIFVCCSWMFEINLILDFEMLSNLDILPNITLIKKNTCWLKSFFNAFTKRQSHSLTIIILKKITAHEWQVSKKAKNFRFCWHVASSN